MSGHSTEDPTMPKQKIPAAHPVTQPEPEHPALPLDGDSASLFVAGVWLDVRKVLIDHGYPELLHHADLVRLQMALFNLLYGDNEYPAHD